MDSQQWRPGQWVEVKNLDEILASLDADGRLDGLPFMPEMIEYCGHRFQVFKRAHKTCDSPNGLGSRFMPDAVHLEGVRCNGRHHGGCQARCLIFWKDSWLKEAPEPAGADDPSRTSQTVFTLWGSSHQNAKAVWTGSRKKEDPNQPHEPLYVCQSTTLPTSTRPIPTWDLRQYVQDYRSGNVGLWRILTTFLLYLYRVLETSRLGLGWFLRWSYDLVQKSRGGTLYPWRWGAIPNELPTPRSKLDLKPGEFARVKSYPEIVKTIHENRTNHGMIFDPEMVPYCGGTYRVLDRVTRIIDEKTGRLQTLKNDCIILENVVCKACYIKKQRFCSRSIYPFWREVWLERVAESRGEKVRSRDSFAVDHT